MDKTPRSTFPPKPWIATMRKAKGLTAELLGESVGVTGPAITMMERGERGLTIELAKAIAQTLGVHYVDVIDGPGVNLVADTAVEKKVLTNVRAMQDKDQENYARMGDILSDGDPAPTIPQKKKSDSKKRGNAE